MTALLGLVASPLWSLLLGFPRADMIPGEAQLSSIVLLSALAHLARRCPTPTRQTRGLPRTSFITDRTSNGARSR
ncbi:hypothetical protein B0J11DRAFT_77799 [Dendryphion nanum]|uniref:Uncharacterized protein n=1 Tax=Dendryphion nanum TaxID=256645 RepID=A0A9P9DH04_9PLEO|nr:hypothetical protein B0J11DRAFT_77799 [Dendryphion nanum]